MTTQFALIAQTTGRTDRGQAFEWYTTKVYKFDATATSLEALVEGMTFEQESKHGGMAYSKVTEARLITPEGIDALTVRYMLVDLTVEGGEQWEWK